ncbi:Hypothetical predicted protein, partial [Pelobates cultripes]
MALFKIISSSDDAFAPLLNPLVKATLEKVFRALLHPASFTSPASSKHRPKDFPLFDRTSGSLRVRDRGC